MAQQARRAEKQAAYPRTRIRQSANRAVDDRDVLYRILDAALIGHVALIERGEPVSIPTAVARVDDHLYLHGSRSSRLYRHLAAGHPVCVSFCLLDGLVKARSAFHCSMNYRSVVVFGRGTPVASEDKAEVLFQVTERLFGIDRGHYRDHLKKELKATELVRIPLAEASVKVRSGGPVDDEEDLDSSYWAGEYPLRLVQDSPVPAPELADSIAAPECGWPPESGN